MFSNLKRVWVISDTHGQHRKLVIPDDIDGIIHVGDGGTYKNPVRCYDDLDDCLTWLDSIPVKNKVYIPGNHDTALEANLIKLENYPSVKVLINESTDFLGKKLYGTPYTPVFHNWAYNKTEEELNEIFQKIPLDTDILVTHGPSKGILDLTDSKLNVGSISLLKAVEKIRPLFHLVGHIHEQGGERVKKGKTTVVNAAVLNEKYELVRNGTIIRL